MKRVEIDRAPPEVARDGRTIRAERTRDAVIEALHALITAGDPKPNAQRIAERAGVSTRTVFAHFASLDDLYRAAVERATALVLALLTPIDPARPLDDRIDDLVDQRARVAEEIGPLRRAAGLQEPFSPALAETRRFARQASHEQVERVFAGELAPLDPDARRRCVATVDALVSAEAWDLLRQTHELTPVEARRALGESLRALLPATSRAETAEDRRDPTGARQAARARSDAARARAEQQARRAAARRALAEIDEKVDRLIAAIEAGSPADLLAARLQALRAARRSAERDLAAPEAGTDADAPAPTRQH